jgi:hypothetical protein
VANATYDPATDQWFALQPSRLYRAHRLLDGFFQRELFRSLLKRGFNIAMDKGMPVVRAVTAPLVERLSKAHATIKAKAAQLAPRKAVTPGLRKLNSKKWENYLNDTYRPPKPAAAANFDKSLTAAERKRILSDLMADTTASAPAPATAEQIRQRIYSHVAATSRMCSEKAIVRSTLAAAAELTANPLDDFLDPMNRLIAERHSLLMPPKRRSRQDLPQHRASAAQRINAPATAEAAITASPTPARRRATRPSAKPSTGTLRLDDAITFEPDTAPAPRITR